MIMGLTVAVIILAGAAIIFGVGFGIEKTKNAGKGKRVTEGFDKAEKVVDAVDAAADIAATVMPNPVTSTFKGIADRADVSTKAAEQLYLNGSITADQRKEEAKTILKQALGLDGIAYEGDVANLGDKAIEAAVYALDKTSTKKVTAVSAIPSTTAPAAKTA
jgi:hypothetical protein